MIPPFLRDVCKVGQGAASCRYVTMGADGWTCAKAVPALRRAIDARAAGMNAKSDNCDGVDDLDAKAKESNDANQDRQYH